MINNLKLNHIDQAQAQTIKNNEIELLRIVDCFNDKFQIGNDQDAYCIKKKIKKNESKKNKSITIEQNTTELV